MGGRDLALANIVEQGFCFVRERIQFAVADNAAVALHVVEETENIVDQFITANGIFFQIQQGACEVFDGVVGLIDKIFQVPFTKGGEGICRQIGQRLHPLFARHGRKLFFVCGGSGWVVVAALAIRLRSFIRRRLFITGGRLFNNRGRFDNLFWLRRCFRLSGHRLRRCFASHDGIDLSHDVPNLHFAFGVGGFKIVDHLAQGIGGCQDDIHDLRGHNHCAFAQFVQNILRLVRQLIDAVQPQKTRCALEGVHGPKDIIQQSKIVRRLLKLKKVRLDGFEMFFGFRDKIGEKFRIKKFLAHNLYLYMAESTLLPELDTYCLSYRLSQKHLYITDHFFRLRRFYHIQVGSEAHACLDVLFLPFG